MDKGRVLPELISGPRTGLAWVVKECKAMDSKVKLGDGSQSIHVPSRVLRQDWLVQQHELTHVADIREMAQLPKDKHSRRFFKMLCEVAVEAISLHRNGVDIRQARDHLDWASFPLPEAGDMTKWAQLWLQFTFSADASEHPGIRMLYQRACDTLGAERVGWLCQARDAVVLDPSGRTRLAWSDWLGKCFPRHADTPKPPEQPKPEPGKGEPNAAEKGDGSEESQEETEQDESTSATGDSDSSESDMGDGESGETTEPSEVEETGESDESDNDTGSDGRDDSDSSDDSDAGSDVDSGDGRVETTDQDDDDWATPSEQVEERGGAGRLRAALEQEQEAREAKERLERAIDAAWNPDAEHGVWIVGGAKIDIHRHTATRVARKLPGRGGSKASDVGQRLAFPRRLYQDGRVLARTGRHGGGILVDGSGSMAWSQAKVDAACAILPGLWVGWYSLHEAAYAWARANLGGVAFKPTAEDYTRVRREAPYWARLCIIAERGRVAEYKPGLELEHSGGNEVDGDCLAYFARVCQGPKVWVSDGQVYGAPGHAEQCAKVMRQHNIVRVDTVDDAVAYLTGKAVMGYRDCSIRKHKLVKG